MLTIEIPGRERLRITHLVLDLNGTLAVDGRVPATVVRRLRSLGRRIRLHIVTADTFGTASRLVRLGVDVHVLPPGDHGKAKAALARDLGAAETVAIGNGSNDALVLRRAALGIAVIGREGASGAAVRAATILVTRVEDALDLLLKPKRLTATLRTR